MRISKTNSNRPFDGFILPSSHSVAKKEKKWNKLKIKRKGKRERVDVIRERCENNVIFKKLKKKMVCINEKLYF